MIAIALLEELVIHVAFYNPTGAALPAFVNL